MSYQALYRTWRPESFRDVVGQDRIITTLVNQIISDRIPHAYLFCGSRGTGKTSTAKVLARAVNCLSPEDGNPCGVCEACRQLAGESNLDIAEIDAASNNGVDEIRDLRDKIKYPPTVGRYKVYIIDEVHMLSAGAFNALLKTLEEPPAHAVFILATTEPQKLPATILSRCQRFDFGRIPAHTIEKRIRDVLLPTGVSLDDRALSMVSRAAEGGMRDAWSILDMCLSYGGGKLTVDAVREVLGSSSREFLFDFAASLIIGDIPRALSLIDQLMRSGRDPAVFTREVTAHIRSLLIAKSCPDGLDDLLEITQEDAAQLLSQAVDASSARLTRTMSLFIQAENDMKWSSQQRTVLELCAVRACHPEREIQDSEALEDRLNMLEKAVSDGVSVVSASSRAANSTAEAPKKVEKAAPKTIKPPESEEQGWQDALKKIGKSDAKLFMVLRKAHFAGIKDDQAVINMDDEGSGVFAAIINKPERREVIDTVLSEVFGKPLHLKCDTQTPSSTNVVPIAGRQNLEQVYEAFTRSKVEVKDEV